MNNFKIINFKNNNNLSNHLSCQLSNKFKYKLDNLNNFINNITKFIDYFSVKSNFKISLNNINILNSSYDKLFHKKILINYNLFYKYLIGICKFIKKVNNNFNNINYINIDYNDDIITLTITNNKKYSISNFNNINNNNSISISNSNSNITNNFNNWINFTNFNYFNYINNYSNYKNDLIIQNKNDLIIQNKNDLVIQNKNDLVIQNKNDLVIQNTNDLVIQNKNDLVIQNKNDNDNIKYINSLKNIINNYSNIMNIPIQYYLNGNNNIYAYKLTINNINNLTTDKLLKNYSYKYKNMINYDCTKLNNNEIINNFI